MSLECGHRRPVQKPTLGDRDRRGAPPREFPHQRRERACTPALHHTRQRLEDSDSQPSRRRGSGARRVLPPAGKVPMVTRQGAGDSRVARKLSTRGAAARNSHQRAAPQSAPHANRKGHDLRGETCLTLNPRTTQLPRFTRLLRLSCAPCPPTGRCFSSARGSSSAPTSRRCWRRPWASSRR